MWSEQIAKSPSRWWLYTLFVLMILPNLLVLQSFFYKQLRLDVALTWEPRNSSSKRFQLVTETENVTYYEVSKEGLRSQMPNRTMVILLGNLRGGEMVWNSLYQNVLDPNMADLALMIGDTRDSYRNASLLYRAKYIWRFPEYDDWADAIDLINGSRWRSIIVPKMTKRQNSSGMLGGAFGHPSSGAIQNMAKFWLMELIQKLQLTSSYDRFILTRSDQYFFCHLDLKQLNQEYIWVPEGQDWGGICDRMYICNSSIFLKTLNVMPTFLSNPAAYARRSVSNVETFLLFSWSLQGLVPSIRRFRRIMFTTGARGDQSRWSKIDGKKEVFDGLFLKYPEEYRMSIKSCQQDNQTLPIEPLEASFSPKAVPRDKIHQPSISNSSK